MHLKNKSNLMLAYSKKAFFHKIIFKKTTLINIFQILLDS